MGAFNSKARQRERRRMAKKGANDLGSLTSLLLLPLLPIIWILKLFVRRR